MLLVLLGEFLGRDALHGDELGSLRKFSVVVGELDILQLEESDLVVQDLEGDIGAVAGDGREGVRDGDSAGQRSFILEAVLGLGLPVEQAVLGPGRLKIGKVKMAEEQLPPGPLGQLRGGRRRTSSRSGAGHSEPSLFKPDLTDGSALQIGGGAIDSMITVDVVAQVGNNH